jgi:glutaredoxin 2
LSVLNLVELRARTRELIDALMPNLEKLDSMIESPGAVNGKLSLDDIRILPRDYFETMMSRIGYQPLPSI